MLGWWLRFRKRLLRGEIRCMMRLGEADIGEAGVGLLLDDDVRCLAVREKVPKSYLFI